MPLEPTSAKSLVSDGTIELMLETARQTPTGAFVEVGVYQGGTAQHLHALAWEQGRKLYLYDTFIGMPYMDLAKGDSHKIGDFSDASARAIVDLCPHALVVQGVFPNSAVDMPKIAFAHVDVDNYRCVKEAAEYLMTRMVPGGVIWFDDSPCLGGAEKATEELFGDARLLSVTGQHYVRFR